MVQDEHSLLRENIQAYALGALDAQDIAALEAHLLVCESCRREVEEYRVMSDNLLISTPPRPPSPALRKRLQKKLPSAQKMAHPRLNWSFGGLAIGGALIALLVMNIFSFLQMRQIQQQQAGLLQQVKSSQFALSMLAYPDTQAISITGQEISGSVLLDRERNTVALVMWHLPELASDQTYQAWLIQPDGDRVSAGTFLPQEEESYTTKPIYSKQAISSFVGVGVTIEPAGGSEQPTGPRIFKVDF